MKNPKKIGKVGVVLVILAVILGLIGLLVVNNKLASVKSTTKTEAAFCGIACHIREKRNAKARELLKRQRSRGIFNQPLQIPELQPEPPQVAPDEPIINGMQ